jgi:phosphinothricin acetyltransferase
MDIRDAAPPDLPFILRVFNQAILETTSTWRIRPTTLADRAAWLDERRCCGFPVLIAELDGVALGFASYGPFRPWEGYRFTVEHSIYVDRPSRGRGVGTALLDELTRRAAAAGHHAMVAGVAADNAVSIRLHERAGFVQAGRLTEVGRKFERWLDLVFMQLMLAAPAPIPGPPG